MRKFILLAAVMFAAKAEAVMPPSCHVHNKVAQKVSEPRLALKTAPQIETAFTTSLLATIVNPGIFALADNNDKKSGNACSHQQAVNRWREWRKRNPNARSRYDSEPPNSEELEIKELNFGPDPGNSEPEPDPSGFGGCGCDPATALASNGCGYWMSNVYGLHNTGNEAIAVLRELLNGKALQLKANSDGTYSLYVDPKQPTKKSFALVRKQVIKNSAPTQPGVK